MSVQAGVVNGAANADKFKYTKCVGSSFALVTINLYVDDLNTPSVSVQDH